MRSDSRAGEVFVRLAHGRAVRIPDDKCRNDGECIDRHKFAAGPFCCKGRWPEVVLVRPNLEPRAVNPLHGMFINDTGGQCGQHGN